MTILCLRDFFDSYTECRLLSGHGGKHVLHVVVVVNHVDEFLHLLALLVGEFLVVRRLIHELAACDFKTIVFQILLDVAVGLERAGDYVSLVVLIQFLGSKIDEFQLQVIESDAVLRCNMEVTLEDLELELIDFGAEEIEQDEEEIIISAAFESNGDIQKYLEENGFEIKSSEFVYEPADYKELNEEQTADMEKLLEVLEEDDDVQNVFTNMKEAGIDE